MVINQQEKVNPYYMVNLFILLLGSNCSLLTVIVTNLKDKKMPVKSLIGTGCFITSFQLTSSFYKSKRLRCTKLERCG